MTEARAGIEQALARFAWAYDADRPAELADCFTADAAVDFGKGWVEGRDDVLAELARRRGVYAAGELPWHVITNLLVREELAGEVTILAQHTFFVAAPGGEPALRSVGYYDDTLVATAGGPWRIRRRRILRPSEILSEMSAR